MGTPGLTMATFMDSLPRSTDITASMSGEEIHLPISPSFPTFLRHLSSKHTLFQGEGEAVKDTNGKA